MEGLEIREDMFSKTIENKDFRIDSQYYTQAPIKNPILKYKKIGDVIHSSQYGISIEMNENGHGYPIYRMNELHNMLCDIEVNKYADITQDECRRFALRNRDVLFNRTNSFEWVGRTGVYYQNDNIERTFASYLVRFNPIESVILPEYFCAFLNTKQGIRDIKRRARQSINQTNVNPEEVKEIEIPILDMDFQLQIQEYFERANLCRLKSLSLYKDAEMQLLFELGLKDWQPNNAPVNIKQLKESFLTSGRLDAEYYQTKYEDYAEYIRKYKNGSDVLGNLCSLNEKNFKPEDNTEYNYIELSDIGNSGEITGCTTSIGAELPSRARRFVQTNDVIVSSIEGSLQSVALVTAEYDKAICSTGFYVVKSKTINPETLLVLFKSEPMQNLLRQGCSGTILTAIGRNELQNIVMPKIRNEVQTEIAEYVQKSISLRKEAKQLLENAKLQVECKITNGGGI
ncbi:MAG: restriction endonuclease subunit S [Bacteroidales bacterium]|nr:restriction endonuclease subunit S [Bacteroidales bacterium]